jgi:hypothetical protein
LYKNLSKLTCLLRILKAFPQQIAIHCEMSRNRPLIFEIQTVAGTVDGPDLK